MSKTYYDARSANLTLGMEIIETNRNLKELISAGLARETIGAMQATIDWMDGYLQHYRKYMRLKFFDPELQEMVEFKDYDSAILHIHKKLLEKKGLIDEDPMQRMEYVFWLNRWAELQASCFHKLQILPPPRMDENNRQMLDEDPGSEPGELKIETLEEVGYDADSAGSENYPIQP